MGIKDRLKGLKAGLSSGPVDTKLTELGSPDRVAAGGTATINVQVTGENDGTVDRIELVLHTPQYERLPLADVPIAPGLHPVAITLPADLPPSVSPWTDYSLRARVLRNQGLDPESSMPIDVIGHPDHLYWPKEPRAGRSGEGVTIEVLPDRDVVDTGMAVTGRVRLTATSEVKPSDVELRLIATLTQAATPKGKAVSSTALAIAGKTVVAPGAPVELPFSIDLPEAAPPTMQSGETTIVWRLEAMFGKATGWRLLGVLDPKADAGIRNRKSQGLAGLMTGSPDV